MRMAQSAGILACGRSGRQVKTIDCAWRESVASGVVKVIAAKSKVHRKAAKGSRKRKEKPRNRFPFVCFGRSLRKLCVLCGFAVEVIARRHDCRWLRLLLGGAILGDLGVEFLAQRFVVDLEVFLDHRLGRFAEANHFGRRNFIDHVRLILLEFVQAVD